MSIDDLQKIVVAGEDSQHQFKQHIHNVDSLAAEMAAFANSEGGMILIGAADDGSIPGLSSKEVSKANQLISNAASQHVRSPLTVQTENVLLENGHVVIVLRVPKGIDKPYFDKNGVIWLKSGADKRRVNSKEELRRLFQSVDLLHADAVPTGAGIDQLEKLYFGEFLRDVYQQNLPESEADLLKLLQNMNLATDDGMLNLACVLLFAKRPQSIKPVFVVKAVSYSGTEIDVANYLDSEDFEGPMQKVFEDALAFIMRNLRKVQAGQSVNSLGKPEIPQIVFEELLVNALIHRDYFISAPIRLFFFNDRIEIVSPGSLPNNLTVEKIKAGNSAIRNPILASFAAKKLLPYRGLGSGIKRAIEAWSHIEFVDDHEGDLFISIIRRVNEA